MGRVGHASDSTSRRAPADGKPSLGGSVASRSLDEQCPLYSQTSSRSLPPEERSDGAHRGPGGRACRRLRARSPSAFELRRTAAPACRRTPPAHGSRNGGRASCRRPGAPWPSPAERMRHTRGMPDGDTRVRDPPRPRRPRSRAAFRVLTACTGGLEPHRPPASEFESASPQTAASRGRLSRARALRPNRHAAYDGAHGQAAPRRRAVDGPDRHPRATCLTTRHGRRT
jgi:hypothetical protein